MRYFIVFKVVSHCFRLGSTPTFCKTLPAQLLFLVFLFLASCICFSHLFQSLSHAHTSSGEDPAPTAGGRIHNELKPLGFYAGGPANASAGLVSAVSQSAQPLMELRPVRISGITDSRFTVVLCQRFSLYVAVFSFLMGRSHIRNDIWLFRWRRTEECRTSSRVEVLIVLVVLAGASARSSRPREEAGASLLSAGLPTWRV